MAIHRTLPPALHPGAGADTGGWRDAVGDDLSPNGPRKRHRRRDHAPRHRRDEQRVARTVAAGAAGAVAIGAVFGLAAGKVDNSPASFTPQATGNGLDAVFLDDRGEQASRGLSSRAPETGAQTVGYAQTPQVDVAEPEEPEGPAAAPLPDVPEDCEDDYEGNREIGCSLLSEFGFGLEEMPALDELWTEESGWNHLAENPSSGACGIPQALPCDKMSSVAGDFRENPATQIRWGLGYISDRYGTPTAAWDHWQANGWY